MTHANSNSEAGWLERLTGRVSTAPAWMCELASAEIHIAGFTNVQLDHPVIDVSGVASNSDAERTVIFFLAASLARGATLARVYCGRGTRGNTLLNFVRRNFRGAILRIDGENLALMRYFDVYLKLAPAVSSATGTRIERIVARALANQPDLDGQSGLG